MDPFLIGALVVGAGALTAWLAHLVEQQHARSRRAWDRAAELVSGEFQPAGGSFLRPTPMQIRARVSDVTVFVDHYTVSTGKSSVTYTRARAAAAAACGLSLRVYREHLFATLGKALGFQDIEVGDPDFDDLFVIKASNPDLARAWLAEEVRDRIARAAQYSFELKGSEVVAQRAKLEDDPLELEAAIRGAATLAGGGVALLGRLREVAEALEGSLVANGPAFVPDGSVAIVVDRPGTQIIADAVWTPMASGRGEAGIESRVKTSRQGAVRDRFVVWAGDDPAEGSDMETVPLPEGGPEPRACARSTSPDLTSQRLDPALLRDLSRVAPVVAVGCDDAVTLRLPGLVLDRARMRIAVDLAERLAAPLATTPYR